jgi:hypothetical protein
MNPEVLKEDAPEQVTDPEEDQDHHRDDQGHETDHREKAGLVVVGPVGA